MTNRPELHRRLLADVIAIGAPHPLVLTGGDAVRAHRLANRPSQDLDVATENQAPMGLGGTGSGDRSVVRSVHCARLCH